jgi:hypothetical protein
VRKRFKHVPFAVDDLAQDHDPNASDVRLHHFDP